MSEFRWAQARRRRSPWLGAALAVAVGAALVVVLAALAGCGTPAEVRRSAETLAASLAAIRSDHATYRSFGLLPEGRIDDRTLERHGELGYRLERSLGLAAEHARLLAEACR